MSNDRYYVYIMVSENGRAMYIGMTNNMQRRLCEHRNGTVEGFTKRYKIHKLVYFEAYAHPQEAIAREKHLKGWTRDKKIGLITSKNPEMNDITHSFI